MVHKSAAAVGADHRAAHTGNATILAAERWGEPSSASRPPHGHLAHYRSDGRLARNWDNGHLARCGSGRACRGPTGVSPVAVYGLAPDTPEPEIVAHLFKLYADKSKE